MADFIGNCAGQWDCADLLGGIVNAQQVRMNMEVEVVAGEYKGRKGHVMTLPLKGHPGVGVLMDEGRGIGPAFVVDEAYLEERDHEQD